LVVFKHNIQWNANEIKDSNKGETVDNFPRIKRCIFLWEVRSQRLAASLHYKRFIFLFSNSQTESQRKAKKGKYLSLPPLSEISSTFCNFLAHHHNFDKNEREIVFVIQS